MENFDARTAAFLSWFKAQPGAQFSDSIALQNLTSRNAGRGIVAVGDIAADTTLFTIPRDMVMTMQTSKVVQAPELKAVFSRDEEDGADDANEDSKPDGWSKLILVMIYECLLGDGSKWKAYFDVIPEEFETPMFWAEEEVEQLQASALRNKIGKASAETMFRQKVLPHIRHNPHVFQASENLSDEDLVRVCHRMGSAIMAYAFDLDDNEDEDEEGENEDGWMEDREAEGLMGMVPMADMMNADAEFNAHVNHEENALVVTALRPIKKGEEILNYYGPHPNSELLRRYGYVTQKHTRYDVVEIPWQLVQNVLQQQLGVADKTMDKIRGKLDELEFEDTFVLERETGEPNAEGILTQPAQLTSLPEDLMDQLKSALKIVSKLEPHLIPDKRKRDEVQHAVLAKSLQTLLSAYGTSLAEDEAILAGSSLGDRHKMTIIVRAGEKKLLGEALDFLHKQDDEDEEMEGQSAKRQRRG
ncbi:SET domain-containing protein [Sarocladium implicatum]|nr:SET domain-containing protein [Sarocladium implicatum]